MPQCTSTQHNNKEKKISLIHFELILVQSERQGSNFRLQHVVIKFLPAPFVDEAVFSPKYIVATVANGYSC
jgi:hypothetical protein